MTNAVEPNQINFMTWGDVNLETPGKVIIQVKEKTVELLYDEEQFDPLIEPIELKEKKLSGVWGDTIYRLSLRSKSLEKSGEYEFSIQTVR